MGLLARQRTLRIPQGLVVEIASLEIVCLDRRNGLIYGATVRFGLDNVVF